MKPATKLAAFVLAMALVFAGAFAVGAAAPPVGVSTPDGGSEPALTESHG